MPASVVEIMGKPAFDQLAGREHPVIIDFTATWCGPCKMIGPHFASMSGLVGGLRFFKIDADKNRDVVQACGVGAFPTFQVWKAGAKVDEMTGADPNALGVLVRKWDYPLSATATTEGDAVLIDGLVSKPELNGKRAVVVTPAAAYTSGRVVVAPGGGADTLALKPERITLQTAPATEAAPPKSGDHVVVDGLVSKPEFNGLRGVAADDAADGKVTVKLTSTSSIRVKLANLAVVARGEQ
mmetsp:Transcript_21641/g.56457  ORF Transcript_21641/g.56457 Transcript_21641/m.56457 type:complete len:240 (+) Transcript_21641:184-903(+)